MKLTAHKKGKTPDIQEFLELMRLYAAMVAKHKGTVTADDLQLFVLAKTKWQVPRAWWGSVFKAPKTFKKVGFERSTNPPNHGRFLAVWARV